MLNTILHALELRQAASLRRIANTPGAPLGPQARHLAEARNHLAEARAIRTLSLAAAHQQQQNRGQA